jgi:L-lactate dehydrogenase (cytochrome)/(S)-mandelate dehydrogenase
MVISDAVNIEDLHRMAKQHLPKIAFDFIEGGVEDERGLERNRAAFAKHQLVPRYLVDVSSRDQSATIFGRKFASPFGISPTGTAGLFRRGADMMLAEAAREANIAYIISGCPSLNELGPVARRLAEQRLRFTRQSATRVTSARAPGMAVTTP